MSQSITALFNLAATEAGARGRIASPDELSREAQICRTYIDHVRDYVLSFANWACARKYVRLNLLAERDFSLAWQVGMPEPDFRYAYGLPSDFIYPRYLHSFGPFRLGSLFLRDQQTKALMTDTEDAVLCYTFRCADVTQWEPQLYLAVAMALAASICKPLSGNAKDAQRLADQAMSYIASAQTADANMDQWQLDWLPEWYQARGYSDGMIGHQRFIYPTNTTFSLGALTNGN